MIRFIRGKYRFIRGKYSGNEHDEIDFNELNKYLIWLAKNTDNEATVRNVLKVLDEINSE